MQVSTGLFALLAAVAYIDRVSAQLPKTKCQSDHDGKGPLRDEPFELKIKSTGKGYACKNSLTVGRNKLVHVKCTGKLAWGSSIGIYRRRYFSCRKEKECGPCFETYIKGNELLVFESSKFVDQKEEINCKISPVPDMKNPTDATESPPILKTNAENFRLKIDESYITDYKPILENVPELQHQITVGGVKKQVFFSDFSRPEGSVVEKFTKVQNPEVQPDKSWKKGLISMDFFGKLKFKTSFRAPGFIKGNVEYDISEKFQVRTVMRMMFDAGKVQHKFVNLEIFEKSSDYGVTAKVTCEPNDFGPPMKTECEKVGEEIKKKPVFEILIRSVFEATRTRWMEKFNEKMKSLKGGVDVPFEMYFVFLAKKWIPSILGPEFKKFREHWKNQVMYKDGLSGRFFVAGNEAWPTSATVEMMEPTITGGNYDFNLKFKPLKLYTRNEFEATPEKLDREVVYRVTVTLDEEYNMKWDGTSIEWTLVEPYSVKDFKDDKTTKCNPKDVTGSQTGEDYCKLWKQELVRKDDGLLRKFPNIVKRDARLFFDFVKDPLIEEPDTE